MKRYSIEEGEEIENPKVDAFIEEVIALGKLHGFCIGHEDGHGAFQILPRLDVKEDYTHTQELYDEWLRGAQDHTPYLQADKTASSSEE